MKPRIRGLYTYVERCSYLFGRFVGKEILSLTDNLSQCLQRTSISVAEGQEITKHVVTGMVKKRNDECFDQLWNQMMEKKEGMRLLQSLLYPKKRKFHHDTILTVINISIAILNSFIANIILMLLTTLLEILKNDLINPIIRFILNCRILS